jgi:restriction system protein
MTSAWMVRAGRQGFLFDQFKEEAFVSMGLQLRSPTSALNNRDQLWDFARADYPSWSDQAISMAVGQLFRFANEIKIGDRVVTYDPRARSYLCGIVSGNCEYFPQSEQIALLYRRQVKWEHEKPRDNLSEAAQNSLGSISTLFAVSTAVVDELWSQSVTDPEPAGINSADVSPTFDPSYQHVAELGVEKIKDKLARLDWDSMQQLVAGLLRAMDYKTTVSPAGADRGKDIVASPDGFGFQPPRIVVEVKHRPSQRMGAPEIRSFMGGRRAHECGLYVSTGGFTQEAYYEAERASIPLTLMDFERLVAAVLENYHKFDERTRQILPLTQVYWPL